MSPLPDNIALLALDFDGVLTDDCVIVGQDGSESVVCSRSDGLGIALLRHADVPVVILSTETNRVVTARAEKLGITAYQSLKDKTQALADLLREREIDPADVVYVGNDVNDAGCLKLVGCAVVPADAHPAVGDLADITLAHPGGRGAVREIADMILAALGENVESECPV